jgi:hypothetical protein
MAAMSDRHTDSDHPEHDPLDAGLRAAFGAEATAASWEDESVLTALHWAYGRAQGVLLRDEPDEGPTGAVQPGSPEALALAVAADSGRGTGRYDVAGELARGGIGVVLKGRDRDLGREVALKVLRAEHLANPAMVRRLVEEAQIGGQLQHPGVLPVYELGIDAARRPFFAMKLVRGRTLASLLAERSGPADDLRRFLTIFEQAAQTLAYAHARGVIHRDLKPANLMVGAFGEVQVVDWGLAKVLAPGGTVDDPAGAGGDSSIAGSIAGPAASRSEAGSVLGTPAYMAPEQARGEIETLDERCDVFALGALLCEILTGRPPYLGTRDDVLDQARAGRLDEAFARIDSCGADGELCSLARRCLDPDPEARPRDGGEVARAILAYFTATDERTRQAERAATAARAVAASERRARRLAVGLAGAILAALGLGAGGALWSARAQVRAARAELAAQRAQARAEREHRLRVGSALEVLLATEQKGQLLILQAADASDRDAERWANLLAACRNIVEQVAESAPDPAARERSLTLAARLKAKEAVLRQRGKAARPSPRQ